jgi:hypothetical protein
VIASALLLATGAVVAIVLGSGSSSSPATRTEGGVAGSATVQRRDLVETDTESGTLSFAGPHTVYNRLSGTITWLPTVGQLIRPGYVLFRVDNHPVLLLDGTTPAYRDRKSSDSAGPDIRELNAALVRLGYNPDGIVVDDDWQAATTAGVEALQAAWNETETGELKLGTVVFLPGSQLVSTVEGTVGSAVSLINPPSHAEYVSLTDTTVTNATDTTRTNTSGTTPATPTGTTPTPTSTPGKSNKKGSKPKHAKAGKPKHNSRTPSQEQQLQALLALPKAETAQLKNQHNGSSGSSNGSSSGSSSSGKSSASSSNGKSSSSSSKGKSSGSGSNGSSGSSSRGGGHATEILQTTSDRLIVTVDLPATSQTEAVVGAPVLVQMPAGDTVSGRITAVSSVATSSSSNGGIGGNGNTRNNGGNGNNGGPGGNGNSGSSATVPVRIALTQPVSGAGLDQAAVSVEFAESKATNVLSVPVTALLATSGSSYVVQEAAPPHELIPVTTGLFAAGYVQISGPGVYPGLQVTDSQG